jgi:hypothetical protein
MWANPHRGILIISDRAERNRTEDLLHGMQRFAAQIQG